MRGGYWPNVELVADKCLGLAEDDAKGKDVSCYLAGQSPKKSSGSKIQQQNFDRSETPIKPFNAHAEATPPLRQ